jgi:hypothetical protein
MTRATTKAFDQEEFDLGKVRDRLLLRVFFGEDDPDLPEARISNARIDDALLAKLVSKQVSMTHKEISPTADLLGEAHIEYPATCLQPRLGGSPALTGDYSYMDSICEKHEEVKPEPIPPDRFLEEVYIQVSAGRVPAAMDAVFDHLDRLLNDGLFGVCDKLLARVDLERMPSSVRRAFLAVTRPAKQELPARAAFYNEALRLLSQERGEQTARKMLNSLA